MRCTAAFLALFILALGCGGKKVVDPGNQGPRIQGIVANPNVIPRRGTSRLTLLVSDPNDDPLTYQWIAAAGTFSDSVGSGILWHAPDLAGVYNIRVVVSDGVLEDSTSANITVGSGTAVVTSEIPGYPIVVNGVASGRATPDTLKNLPVGDYSIEIGSNFFRFAPSETTFTLSDQEVVSVHFRLPPPATEVVDTGSEPVDEIGGLTYYPGGIGVLYAARVGADTTLRSASLAPTHAGENGRVLHRPVMLLESIAVRTQPGGRPPQIAFVSADRIRIGELHDTGSDGLVEQIDSLATLGGVFGEAYGPAMSLDGSLLGYALMPSTPPNTTDLLLVGNFDGRQVTRPRFAAFNRGGNNIQFGPEPWAVFESGGEIYQVEIDTLQSNRAEQITATGGTAFSPAFSPDGRYNHYMETGAANKLRALQEETTLTLRPSVSTTHVAWSPDGRELLIADNSQIGNARLLLVYNLPIH
jgi:hypothetical protein